MNEEPQDWFDDDSDQEETPPGSGWRLPAFALLDDVLKSLGSAWDDFRTAAASTAREFVEDAWTRVGDLITAAGDWFRQIDYEIRESVRGWRGYSMSEYPELEVKLEGPPSQGYEYRKSFVDADDVMQYLRAVRHLDYEILYIDSYYHLYVASNSDPRSRRRRR